jgi:diguanylate cyclase (GGDEF)-like protein
MHALASERQRQLPLSVAILSTGALMVPLAGTLMLPDAAAENQLLLWLLALVPAFLLAYYRGWRGAATSLAFGMVALSLGQVRYAVLAREPQQWELYLGLTGSYILVSLAFGYLSEMLIRQREAAVELAVVDPLTSIPNRRMLELALDKAFAAARRGRPLAVVIFDLDRFDLFNRTYGRAAGDEALRIFARILDRHTRRMDTSARHGGEEFVSVLTGSGAAGGAVFAERILAEFAAAPLAGASFLTASAGIAGFDPGFVAAEDLLAAAGQALQRAKAEGRACLRIATAQHDAPRLAPAGMRS